MEIRGVSKSDLEQALLDTNRIFEGNIKMTAEFKRESPTYGNIWKVTLRPITTTHIEKLKNPDTGRMKNFKYLAPGAKYSRSWLHQDKRVHACCWHVFGTFRYYLPDSALVVSMYGKAKNRDPWVDPNVGAPIQDTLYFSELCDCANEMRDLPPYERVTFQNPSNFTGAIY